MNLQPNHSPADANNLLIDKYGIGLFKFAQIFVVSPMDIFVQKGNKPFNTQELNELKSSLKVMWKGVIKRARDIDIMLSRAGGMPLVNLPYCELDLRHTAATYMVIGGIDLVTVKDILGHATIQMTMRYAHPTPGNKRHAVEVLASLFGGPEEKAKRREEELPQIATSQEKVS